MKLDVFDFDNTLFRTPLDTPENHRLYEKHTGIPWNIDKELSRKPSKKFNKHIGMRRGWHGRKETLEPPLVPDPVTQDWFIEPTVKDFLESKKNKDSKTLFMTGRHAGIQSQVMRILADGNLAKIESKIGKDGSVYRTCVDPDVELLFQGMDGPAPEIGNKPHETLPWKIWILNQFYLTLNNLEEINIWEDRESHVEKFKEWGETIDLKVVVKHVIP